MEVGTISVPFVGASLILVNPIFDYGKPTSIKLTTTSGRILAENDISSEYTLYGNPSLFYYNYSSTLLQSVIWCKRAGGSTSNKSSIKYSIINLN